MLRNCFIDLDAAIGFEGIPGPIVDVDAIVVMLSTHFNIDVSGWTASTKSKFVSAVQVRVKLKREKREEQQRHRIKLEQQQAQQYRNARPAVAPVPDRIEQQREAKQRTHSYKQAQRRSEADFRKYLESLPKSGLVSMVVRERKLHDAAAKKANIYKSRATRASTRWVAVRHQHRRNRRRRTADEYHKANGRGTKRAQLSDYGQASIPIMRSCSAASGWRIGIALRTDVSRFTVMRAERRVGAAIQQHSKDWHSAGTEELWSSDAKIMQWCIKSIRCDGTNTNCLRKEAVQVPLTLHSI